MGQKSKLVIISSNIDRFL